MIDQEYVCLVRICHLARVSTQLSTGVDERHRCHPIWSVHASILKLVRCDLRFCGTAYSRATATTCGYRRWIGANELSTHRCPQACGWITRM